MWKKTSDVIFSIYGRNGIAPRHFFRYSIGLFEVIEVEWLSIFSIFHLEFLLFFVFMKLEHHLTSGTSEGAQGFFFKNYISAFQGKAWFCIFSCLTAYNFWGSQILIVKFLILIILIICQIWWAILFLDQNSVVSIGFITHRLEVLE